MWGFNLTRDRLILAGMVILLAYTNCGKVRFTMDVESLRQKMNSEGGVLINNGDEFTNSQDVQLALIHGSADEMYVTNDSSCQGGGVWEPYNLTSPWKLSASNTEGKVYVKYREKAVLGVESDCFADGIVHDDIPPQITITRPVSSFINTSSASVEFTVTDAGSGVTSAQCQADGAVGVACNNVHTQSGLNEGSHEIKIAATDRAGNKAVPQQTNFAVDMTPPVVTLNQTPPKVTASTVGEFSFSATDALSGVERTECKLDNEVAYAACASPFTRNLAEGTHKFFVRAVDNAGNVSQPTIYDWTIDLTAPSVTITKMPPPYTNIQTAVFEFEGTDGAIAITDFECAIDAGAYSSCTSPRMYAAVTAGSHTFAVRGIDAVGNRSAPATYTWVIDLVPPVVTLTGMPDAITNQTSATFTFTAVDLVSGIASIECQLDGGGYAACTSPKIYAAIAEGGHTFNVRATDTAGNTSASVTYAWRVDLTPPVVEILSGPLAQTNIREARLEFRAFDPNNPDAMRVARIECRLDGSVFTSCTSPEIYPALLDGNHVFYARAVDLAGNLSAVETHSWTLDATPPAINFGKMPVPSISGVDPAVVQFTVTDAGVGVDRVMCGLNGALAVCSVIEERTFSNLPAGDYVFRVEATDRVGNASAREVSWKVEIGTMEYMQSIDVTTNSKADVLVIIDNSGSMGPEQENMAARFGTFLDQLKNLDWQVGIITTDVDADADKKDGRFLQMAGIATPTYILNSGMNLDAAKSAFASTIQRPRAEGSGNEQGIRATYRAIQRSQETTLAVNKPNRDFFRTGAAFAALVVTDADETNPAGTQTANTPQGLIDLVRNTWAGQKAFSYHSIIVKPGDSVCKSLNSNETYGLSYDALSKLTGGIVGTVCATDYGSQLTAIGQGVVDLVNSATLLCQPLDTTGDGRPDVRIETPNMTAPAYTVSGNRITFATALPLGTTRLTYTCLRM